MSLRTPAVAANRETSRAASPPRSWRRTPSAVATAICLALATIGLAQEEGDATTSASDTELGRIKQAEARRKLQALEETMDRLGRMLAATEPEKAVKLRSAFQASRKRLVREGMDRVVEFILERKLYEAIQDQEKLVADLEDLLDILLERDIDPRELIQEIRRVRDIVQGLDQVIREETEEKIASDNAVTAKEESDALGAFDRRLGELIEKQRDIEASLGALGDAGDSKSTPESGEKPGEGAGKEPEATSGESRPADGKPGEGESGAGETGEGKPGEGKSGEGKSPGEGGGKSAESSGSSGSESGSKKESGSADAKEAAGPKPPLSDLAKKQKAVQESTRKLASEARSGRAGSEAKQGAGSLAKAAGSMSAAQGAMQSGKKGEAQTKAEQARRELEEARRKLQEEIDRLRGLRDFAAMKKAQDGTQEKTEDVLEKMQRTPPLVYSPEGGVPGRQDVQAASQSMGEASGQLAQGQAGGASGRQQEALSRLQEGRKKAEQALADLQKALRERMLAYLRERITFMLEEQRQVNGETRALDARLRAVELAATSSGSEPPEIERRDLQRAQRLSRQEGALVVVASDVIDLLAEDGTTLVFPRIVGQVQADLENVQGLLAEVETGVVTQGIQEDIVRSLEEILEAIRQAQRKPPPENPNQGRQSKNGTGPLLPASSELKMVLSLQRRVNTRTQRFDLDRGAGELTPSEREQAEKIAGAQGETKDLLRKLARALGER